ncbi:MAG: hypothetical protein GXZ11_02190 [Tissierellia bacterium]|nr:hypothetical protein [Tissierellia bacterium]
MQAIFETLFDIIYLTTVTTIGIKMIVGNNGKKQYLLFGIMATILGLGDAFHLVPRAIALCTTGLESYASALGVGKLVTSMTMTIFYVLLYYIWRERYQIKGEKHITITIWILAITRIVLNAMPQNQWLSSTPPLSWGIYRNIPFALMGLLIIWLFYKTAKKKNDLSFKNMWLTITLSFAFYLPVVMWSNAFPAIGALMIPKTCAYVWTVLIGYNAMRKEV